MMNKSSFGAAFLSALLVSTAGCDEPVRQTSVQPQATNLVQKAEDDEKSSNTNAPVTVTNTLPKTRKLEGKLVGDSLTVNPNGNRTYCITFDPSDEYGLRTIIVCDGPLDNFSFNLPLEAVYSRVQAMKKPSNVDRPTSVYIALPELSDSIATNRYMPINGQYINVTMKLD